MMKEKYITLLKKVLTDYHRMEYGEYKPLYLNDPSFKRRVFIFFDKLLRKLTESRSKKLAICERIEFNEKMRREGKDWPTYADTMIGLKRLENIEFCVNQIIKNKIPGDFIETGVWRGGATIFMKALLMANDENTRVVWVADSFQGLPKPDPKYEADKGDRHHTKEELAIPLEVVQKNFEKYGLLDDKVKFLKGWFKDTLPNSPIQKLALLRLDGDMYESTMDSLTALYPKLSNGGYIIIDDWWLKGCKQAVNDYRAQHGIHEEIIDIDGSGAYWRKT